MASSSSGLLQTIYDLLVHGTRLGYAALGVGLLVAFLDFRVFFKNTAGFEDDMEESRKNPILDEGYDYTNSRWSEGKIMFWIFLSIGSGVLACYQLPAMFPHWFKAP